MATVDQDPPLILELLNLKKAIAACPASPEKDNAMHRADLAIAYARSVLDLYEGRNRRVAITAVQTADSSVSGIRRFLNWPHRK